MIGIEFLPRDVECDVAELGSFMSAIEAGLGVGAPVEAEAVRANARLQTGGRYVIIPSNPRNRASVSSLIAAQILRERLERAGGVLAQCEVVPTISGAGLCGEQGLARLTSELLGVKYAGFGSVAIIGGESGASVRGVEVVRGGDKGVRGVEVAHGAINGIEGIALARQILGGGVKIISGSSVEVGQEAALKRLEAKLAAGADHIITQPLFSQQRARAFMSEFERVRAACGSAARASLNIFGIFEENVARKINRARLGFRVEEAYMKAAFGSLGRGVLESGELDSEALESSLLESGFSESGQDFESFAKSRAVGAFVALREGLMQVAFECGASVLLSSAKHNDRRVLAIFQNLG